MEHDSSIASAAIRSEMARAFPEQMGHIESELTKKLFMLASLTYPPPDVEWIDSENLEASDNEQEEAQEDTIAPPLSSKISSSSNVSQSTQSGTSKVDTGTTSSSKQRQQQTRLKYVTEVSFQSFTNLPLGSIL
jgi:hypothetical protein